MAYIGENGILYKKHQYILLEILTCRIALCQIYTNAHPRLKDRYILQNVSLLEDIDFARTIMTQLRVWQYMWLLKQNRGSLVILLVSKMKIRNYDL